MKITSDVLLVIGIFILVILLSLIVSTSNNVVPYVANTLYPKYGSFEGFADSSEKSKSAPLSLSSEPNTCNKLTGFDGLYCSPNSTDQTIDRFASVSGNASCSNDSSGLSNSMGYLCLTPELKQTLQTRGGNATGVDSQIGQR